MCFTYIYIHIPSISIVTPTRDGITDDDEKAAADWFFNNYPTGEYLSFDEIANGADLSQYRVLWWIRDSQQTTDLPAAFSSTSVMPSRVGVTPKKATFVLPTRISV